MTETVKMKELFSPDRLASQVLADIDRKPKTLVEIARNVHVYQLKGGSAENTGEELPTYLCFRGHKSQGIK